MGKIIVIEGTDCSGKETQSNLLIEKLKKEKYKVAKLSFPDYSSPTGKIIGGPYLGKDYICQGWFKEGAIHVDNKVASLYYAADRRYHLKEILKLKDENDVLILDRYTFSNMAHQGGKILNFDMRYKMYKWIENLEFDYLELPRPDIVIFLHMPYKYSRKLRNNRIEHADEHEKSEEHLKNAEEAYIQLKDLYNFKTIECIKGTTIKSIEEINEEVLSYVHEFLKNNL